MLLDDLVIHQEYDRPFLANLWGYKTWHAIGRGIVTPKGDNKIILFVTRYKQESLTQYADHLEEGILYMEGERNHQNDVRLKLSMSSDDEIFLFYRERHHMPFTYYGQVLLTDYTISVGDICSKFVFKVPH
ncbi:hypothetical protein [Paenibacillus sanguinis]|uniref:hypothetical protein n=1 Tax=Paenibacillus sanguinis TaxID=225906 RepID=UPI0003699292|nr:hypothetical protein [Paenibacillus sanguinis]